EQRSHHRLLLERLSDLVADVVEGEGAGWSLGGHPHHRETRPGGVRDLDRANDVADVGGVERRDELREELADRVAIRSRRVLWRVVRRGELRDAGAAPNGSRDRIRALTCTCDVGLADLGCDQDVTGLTLRPPGAVQADDVIAE